MLYMYCRSIQMQYLLHSHGWELRMAFATVLLVQNTRFVLRNMIHSKIQVRSHITAKISVEATATSCLVYSHTTNCNIVLQCGIARQHINPIPY
jgi:hypothetical protein